MRAFRSDSGDEVADRPAVLRIPPAQGQESVAPDDANARDDTPGLRPRRRRKWAVAATIPALVVVAAAILWERQSAPPPHYATGVVDRGDVVRDATASGMVNPVETVQIGSYVSGRIEDLSCDYNSRVTKGQRCARIDPRSYRATVDQATAAVATAKAQLAKDRANLAYLKRSYERNHDLAQRGVVASDAMENAFNAFQQAQAQTDLDEAMIRQREAEVETAQVNLDYTDIISPVDGTVVSRSAAIGQTVTANFQTPTLFLIATDLARMQVDATVTEAAIGDIREGQKATFTVEAFPDRTFNGAVTQVRQAPVSVQNVISYDVVIAVDNPDLLLKPGMTATTHIVTAQRQDVLRVPEPALRFAPAGVTNTRAQAGGSAVWIERAGAIVRVPVTIGLRDDNHVEVISGELKPGDRVAVARAAGAAETEP